MKGTFQVIFESEPLSDATIIQAIKAAGFEGAPIDIGKSARSKDTLKKKFWSRRGRLVLCATSGVLSFLGFIAHAILHNGIVHALAGNVSTYHACVVAINCQPHNVPDLTNFWILRR